MDSPPTESKSIENYRSDVIKEIAKRDQNVSLFAGGVENALEALDNFLERNPEEAINSLIQSRNGLESFLNLADKSRFQINQILVKVHKKLKLNGDSISLDKREINDENIDVVVRNLMSVLGACRVRLEIVFDEALDDVINYYTQKKTINGEVWAKLLGVKTRLYKIINLIHEWADLADDDVEKVKQMRDTFSDEVGRGYQGKSPIQQPENPVITPTSKPKTEDPEKPEQTAEYYKKQPPKQSGKRGKGGSKKAEASSGEDKTSTKKNTRISKQKTIKYKGKLILAPEIFIVKPRQKGHEQIAGYEVRIVEIDTPDYSKLEDELDLGDDEVIIEIGRLGQKEVAKAKSDVLERVDGSDQKSEIPPLQRRKTSEIEDFSKDFKMPDKPARRVQNPKSPLADEDLFEVDIEKYRSNDDFIALCRSFNLKIKKREDETEDDKRIKSGDGVEDEEGNKKILVALRRKDSFRPSIQRICFTVVGSGELQKLKTESDDDLSSSGRSTSKTRGSRGRSKKKQRKGSRKSGTSA